MAPKIDPLHAHLTAKRIVTLDGKITRESLDRLTYEMVQLRLQSADPITLLIDSGGGDTIASLNFCDFLQFGLNAHVKAIVTGLCGSAATFILLYCTERLGLPHSRYLIHSSETSGVSLKTSPSSKQSREQLNDELDAIHNKVTSMYMQKLGLKRKRIEQLTDRGEQQYNSDMWAEEALELKLIQRIVDKPLDLF